MQRALPPLFSSLFRFRQTEKRTPTEDFLSELLVGFLRCCPKEVVQEFIVTCFVPEGIRSKFSDVLRSSSLTFVTQRQLPDRKRVDILVEINGKAALVIENKIAAAFQMHLAKPPQRQVNKILESGSAEPDPLGADLHYVHQLESYASWLRDSEKPKCWPGLIVVLTHSTIPPSDLMIEIAAKYGVVSHICYWQRLHNRLATLVGNADYKDDLAAWKFLGRELCRFLEAKSMNSSEFTSIDIAAINVAMVATRNAYACFDEVGSTLLETHKGKFVGKAQGTEFTPSSSRVWGWTYFVGPEKIFVGYGVFFPPLLGEMAAANPELPDQEHAFLAVGSEKGGLPTGQTIPEKWYRVNEGWTVVKPFPLTSKERGQSFADFFINLINVNLKDLEDIQSVFRDSVAK